MGWMLGLSNLLLQNHEDWNGQDSVNSQQRIRGRIHDVRHHGVQEQNRHKLAFPAAGMKKLLFLGSSCISSIQIFSHNLSQRKHF